MREIRFLLGPADGHAEATREASAFLQWANHLAKRIDKS
jgi:hypothetical protein